MRKVGVENIEDLIELRRADRQGNGSRDGLPEPIRLLQKRIARIIEDENAITVRDLEVNGNDIMSGFDLKPGPVIGQLLHVLLELVLDDPALNTREFLMQKAAEILPELPRPRKAENAE
jgi:poly(A) polymerase/tRNA nucleotidyltransferase (CCA-adding enzyme)